MARQLRSLAVLLLVVACSGYQEPPPNSVVPGFDARTNSIKLAISGLAPATAATLVSPQGDRFPASGISVVRGPYIAYNSAPSIGLGIGGFGFSGCCSGFGTGIGVAAPIGAPTPAGGSDQWISSALIPVPIGYEQTWTSFRIEVQMGQREMTLPAPSPAS